MNLYLLTRDNAHDYDEYDSCVVCAENEEDAKSICPDGSAMPRVRPSGYWSWVLTPHVICEFLGEAKPDLLRGVVCSSFNPG